MAPGDHLSCMVKLVATLFTLQEKNDNFLTCQHSVNSSAKSISAAGQYLLLVNNFPRLMSWKRERRRPMSICPEESMAGHRSEHRGRQARNKS
nr:hypothetical protein BgiMline_025738 [Biomphalaria glabrata]